MSCGVMPLSVGIRTLREMYSARRFEEVGLVWTQADQAGINAVSGRYEANRYCDLVFSGKTNSPVPLDSTARVDDPRQPYSFWGQCGWESDR